MLASFFARFTAIWGIEKEFRLKVLFLTLAFFLLTFCQAIWRPLKTAVFISLVGVKSIPDAKLFLIFPLIILIIFYSKLVDWLRRHHIFYWFTITHGIGGVLCYYFLAHPIYGLTNTEQSTGRIFGWVFYFFLESFGAFMSAVFWSFSNSINKPNDAKNYYGLFVAGSKVGGILGAGLLYLLVVFSGVQDSILLPNALLAGSLSLIAATGAIYFLMKCVPGYYMHGYEAAYQFEKTKIEEKKSIGKSVKEAFDGLILIIKNPYVFGILSIVMFYEVIIVIFDYLVALAASAKYTSAGELTGYYSLYQLSMHSVGFLMALFGTTPIQRFLGIRFALFVCPVLSTLLVFTIFFYPTPEILFFAPVTLRALNYAINHPTREALFIPTTKAIKFKAKVWTDTFGSRTAKALGSWLNKHVLASFGNTTALLILALTSGWIAATYFLGKGFQDAVDKNKVIGAQDNQSDPV